MKKTMIFVALCLYLFGCGGGGGSSGGAVASTLKGTVTFPGTTVAKTASKDVAAITPPISVQIVDLHGNQIASADVTLGGSSDTYNYSTTVAIRKDAVIKAVRGNQVMRAALDSSTVTTSSSTRDLNVITTAAVLVLEQNLDITAGTLGTSAAPVSPPALKTLAPVAVEATLSQAVAASTSGTATNFTRTTAAFANLVAIVTAVTRNNVDAAQYISGAVTVAFTSPITTYSVSPSGTPVAVTVSSDQVATTLSAIISTIKNGTAPTGSITGSITLHGSGLSEVSVTLSSGTTSLTSSSGFYSFSNVPDGSYTITPALNGYVFNPSTISTTVTSSAATGKNFTSTNTGSIKVDW